MTDSQKVDPIRPWLHCLAASDGGPKTPVSHLTACVAVDPLLARIRFLEHRQRSGRSTSSAWPPARNRMKVWHRIDVKNCFLLL